jgi:hypothetical protein
VVEPTEVRTSARQQRSTLSAPAIFLWLAVVVLGIRFFHLIWKYSVNVLFFDQWNFLRLFFDPHPNIKEMFLLQHGPHREGLGLVLDYALYSISRWNSRVEAFAIGICILGGLFIALMLKRKLFGPFEFSDIIIPMIFLTVAQYETLVGTVNLAYSGLPLLMFMLYCGALSLEQPAWKWGSILFLNAMLVFTGFGFFAGPVTITLAALERYRASRGYPAIPGKWATCVLIGALATFGSFFFSYRFTPAVECFTVTPNVIKYAAFVVFMGGSIYGHLTAWMGIISGLFTIALGVFAMGSQIRKMPSPLAPESTTQVIFSLVAFSLSFAANTAVGRLCLGLPEGAQASRYVTLMIPLVLGAYFWLLSLRPLFSITAGWQRAGAGGAIAVLFVFLLSTERAVPADRYEWFTDGKTRWVECYRRTKDIQNCDRSTNFPIYPNPDRTHLQQKLDYLEQHHLNLFSSD